MAYSSEIDQLPFGMDIYNALAALREPLKKMKFRDLSAQRWPQHATYIRLSNDEFNRQWNEASNVAGTAPSNQTPAEALGIKWAGRIECFVDEDATEGEIEEIHDEGWSYIHDEIGELMGKWPQMVDDGRLQAADQIARRMSEVEAGFEALVNSDGNGHFNTIEEKTSAEEWEGDDADKAREQYGEAIRPAAGKHHNMARYLSAAAMAAVMQETRVYMQLSTAVNEAAARVEELTTIPASTVSLMQSIGIGTGTAGLWAVLSWPVTFTLGVIGIASSIVGNYFDVDLPFASEIERIMTAEEAEEIVEALHAATEDAASVYESQIEAASSGLDADFANYHDYMSNPTIIPGQGY